MRCCVWFRSSFTSTLGCMWFMTRFQPWQKRSAHWTWRITGMNWMWLFQAVTHTRRHCYSFNECDETTFLRDIIEWRREHDDVGTCIAGWFHLHHIYVGRKPMQRHLQLSECASTIVLVRIQTCHCYGCELRWFTFIDAETMKKHHIIRSKGHRLTIHYMFESHWFHLQIDWMARFSIKSL